MDPKIKTILDELYGIDPKLRQHQVELARIVQRLLATQPDTKFDRRFARQLRQQLLAASGASSASIADFIINFLTMRKFTFAAGGIAVVALLIVPALYFSGALRLPSASPVGSQIVMLDDNAFGALTGSQPLGLGAGNPEADRSSTASGITLQAGEIAPAPAADAMLPADAPVGFGGGGTVGKMIAPGEPYPYTQIQYVYAGDPIELPETKMEVLRRNPSGNQVAIRELVPQLGLGLLDLSSFSNPRIKSAYFDDGRDDGFSVNVDFVNGMVSMDRNIQYDYNQPVDQLSMSDVPSDETLIAMAKQFVEQRGIDLSNYGEPVVQNQWRLYALEASRTGIASEALYIPDYLSVVFPLEIKDVAVYDQSGNYDGLYVGINIRLNQVVNLSNLTAQRYDASLYDVITDVTELLRTYNQQFVYQPEGAVVTTVNVELGTPDIGLVKIWHWDGRLSQELYVPAYIFPVLNKPADQPYFQDRIIIPLAKDLLENFGGGPIILMEGRGGAEGTVTDPAPAAPPTSITPSPVIEPDRPNSDQ